MEYLALALSLLQTVLASAQKGNAEQSIIANVQAAMQALAAVEGTSVTYQQLEDLRVKATF